MCVRERGKYALTRKVVDWKCHWIDLPKQVLALCMAVMVEAVESKEEAELLDLPLFRNRLELMTRRNIRQTKSPADDRGFSDNDNKKRGRRSSLTVKHFLSLLACEFVIS